MKTKIRFHKFLNAVFLSGALSLFALPAQAVLSLADNPLFLTVALPPNIVMTLDDSGSMISGFVPDTIAADMNTRRFASADFNALYYNPRIRYVIPTRRDGVTYTTSFTAAKSNGFDGTRGTVDLRTDYRVTVYYYNDLTTNDGFNVYSSNPAALAYYYVFDSANNNCDGLKTDEDCYDRVNVSNTSGPTGAYTNTGEAIVKDERQNFANWYSFYRTRALTTISGAMSAVDLIDDNQVRFAWQSLNDTAFTSCNSFASGNTCRGYTATTYDNRIRELSAAHRTNFYNFLQRFSSEGGTPLRTAIQRAGQYYSTSSGTNNPYAEFPQVSLGTELSCRKNYHVLMTDGIWNSDNITAYGNADSVAATLPDGIAFPAALAPYSDGNSDSVADIAFYFWRTDLRTDLVNNVPPYTIDRSGNVIDQYRNPKNDPATWQHMVNFNVGLGLTSTMINPVWGGSTYLGDYPLLVSAAKTWPATGVNVTPGNVYDLWHSALNSRGQFFSAEAPQDIGNAFRTILNTISDATPSAAALAANSTSIVDGTLVYQAKFDTRDWSGSLSALPVQGDGSIGSAIWDAATRIPTPAQRNIFTISSGTGKTFTNCNVSLNAAQKLALDTNAVGVVDNKCTDRLNWLRGDTSKEVRFTPGGTFRNRLTTVLGDIINSDPAFSFNEDYGYGALPAGTPGQSSYAAYLTSKASRTPALFVGANDGMLHAFRADVDSINGGRELFAFIPAGVYANLSKLTDPAYTHKFYVDGPPKVGDAFLGGSWKTILVGGLGAGGKSIYALDVSNAAGFAASDVLWEFSDAADLGYTYSQPQIARTNDTLNPWVAIFGNGYNSTSDKSFLYIVNLQTGALIKKIPTGNATANGLSTVTLYDANGDMAVDAVYAGDLQGNLWEFDLSSTSAAGWQLANSGNPLFTARNSLNEVQPITSQPQVGVHTDGGVLVYFGTGQYLANSDSANTQVQTYYAIWDNGLPISTTDRSQLQQQSITLQNRQTFLDANGNEFSFDVRESSANTVDYAGGKRGWYMDLQPPATAGGERIVSRSLLIADRVIFVTVVPSTDRCEAGGVSWLFELNSLTGARLENSVFDFNNDGAFNGLDAGVGPPKSALKLDIGISKTPVYLNTRGGSNEGKDTKVFSGTSGGTATVDQPCTVNCGVPEVAPRVFWRQII